MFRLNDLVAIYHYIVSLVGMTESMSFKPSFKPLFTATYIHRTTSPRSWLSFAYCALRVLLISIPFTILFVVLAALLAIDELLLAIDKLCLPVQRPSQETRIERDTVPSSVSFCYAATLPRNGDADPRPLRSPPPATAVGPDLPSALQ